MLALLRLVEHFRSPRRTGPASRGHYQPAVVLVGHRHANAPCAPYDDPHHLFSRQGQTGGCALAAVAIFLRGLAQNAEQLARLQKWRAILSRAFRAFLNGRLIRPPPRLAPC